MTRPRLPEDVPWLTRSRALVGEPAASAAIPAARTRRPGASSAPPAGALRLVGRLLPRRSATSPPGNGPGSRLSARNPSRSQPWRGPGPPRPRSAAPPARLQAAHHNGHSYRQRGTSDSEPWSNGEKAASGRVRVMSSFRNRTSGLARYRWDVIPETAEALPCFRSGFLTVVADRDQPPDRIPHQHSENSRRV